MRAFASRLNPGLSPRTGVVLVALALGFASLLAAQGSPSTAAADSLLASQKWSEAAVAYAAVTSAEPANGWAWTNLGESYLQLRRHDDAIGAFAKAEALRFRPFMNAVNQARAFAEKHDDAQVMIAMQRVIDGGAGGALKGYILGSTAFARLADDARWQRIVAQLKPCVTTPYRQFDFWIGDWDVFGAAGGMAGHNVVTLEQEGCLLVEHWVGAGAAGGTGMSFNYFDVRDRKWHQLYISNTGNAGAFPALTGSFDDGKMVMLTDDVNNVLSRWTWYLMAPGRVKQMAEVSRDHGKTWQTTFNAVYVRKGETP